MCVPPFGVLSNKSRGMRMTAHCRILIAAVLAFAPASALAQDYTPYGESIKLEEAKKLIAAAEAEATKQKWPVAIAIVDGSGRLVAFAKMDNTQYGSIEIA